MPRRCCCCAGAVLPGGRSRSGRCGAGVLREPDLGAVFETIGAVDHHDVPDGQARSHDDTAGIARTQGDRTHAHRLIGVHDVDVGARRTALHRRLRDERCALQRAHQEVHVHELIRKELLVLVGKDGLEPYGAGGDVDLAVDALQAAGRELRRMTAIERRDGECLAGLQLREDGGNLVLRQREHDRDRFHLRDHHEPVRFGRRYVVAERDLLQTGAAVDRRGDVAIDQVQFRGIDLCLIGLHNSDVLLDERLLRRQLLLGDRILREERGVAFKVNTGVRQERFVARQRPFGLLQSNLIGTRVDLDQKIALFDRLAFLERDLGDLAADLALHRNRGDRRDRAEPADHDRHGAALCAGRGDRHRRAGRTKPASGGYGCVRLQSPGQQDQGGDRTDQDEPAPRQEPAPAGDRGSRAQPGLIVRYHGRLIVDVVHGGLVALRARAQRRSPPQRSLGSRLNPIHPLYPVPVLMNLKIAGEFCRSVQHRAGSPEVTGLYAKHTRRSVSGTDSL